MRVATSVFVLLDIKETTVMVSSCISLNVIYALRLRCLLREYKHFLSFLKYIYQGEQDNKSILGFDFLFNNFSKPLGFELVLKISKNRPSTKKFTNVRTNRW